jgi:acetyl-CoA C-acetyltransferase
MAIVVEFLLQKFRQSPYLTKSRIIIRYLSFIHGAFAMSHDPIVIVNGARTPMGGFQGCFASVTAPELGAVAIKEAVARAGLQADDIQEVIMGCVLPAGLKQGPARQAMLKAGLPASTGATTINKLCGSGMKATMFAHDLLVAGSVDIAVAGGMESMTNAPYILAKARNGFRMGHGEIKDHMFLDGLEDAETGRLMGSFAQDMANKLNLTREQMDEFAIASLNAPKKRLPKVVLKLKSWACLLKDVMVKP